MNYRVKRKREHRDTPYNGYGEKSNSLFIARLT